VTTMEDQQAADDAQEVQVLAEEGWKQYMDQAHLSEAQE
jgi:hypothetical protein